jgi:acyl carrier protein
VRSSDGVTPGCFDVVFRPRGAAVAERGEALPRQSEEPAETLERYANRPRLAAPASAPVLAELGDLLRLKLPGFMLPSAYVVLDALPMTPNGKVDRRALPSPATGASTLTGASYVPPRTAVESLLAGMWSQVLGLERVGINDDFFTLGGHSLLATQLLARIYSTFQVEIPLRRLFETPTVATLAQAVVAHEARPGRSEAMAQLLEKVKGLSPSELQRELQSRQAAGGSA